MQERLSRLRAMCQEQGLDAVLITSVENIRYQSGFTSSDGMLLVTNARSILFTDFRYTIQAKEQTQGVYEVAEVSRNQLVESLSKALSDEGCRRCGFEQSNMTVGRFERFQNAPVTFVPVSDSLNALRLIKSASEIASLQKAQSIAEAGYARLLTLVKPGMTELEVAAELQYQCAKLGSEGPAFDYIVGSGPNGAMCHAVPGERRLQSGDLVVVDFGCMANGYRSDMTRTFGVGRLDPELVKIYDVTREAQRRALDVLKPGLPCAALDAVARDYITEMGYGACFGHSLGHGFGLNIHEAPTASTVSKETFAAGMTVTVEPGIYLEGKGGVRIEDCCVLTNDGYINLVSSPKELWII